jgi:hypothetical protein
MTMDNKIRAERNKTAFMDSIKVEYFVDTSLRFTGKVWDKSDTGIKILVNTKNLFLTVGTWGMVVLIKDDIRTEYWGETIWVEQVYASSQHWVGMRLTTK